MAQEKPGALVWDTISGGYATIVAVAYDCLSEQTYYALDSGREDDTMDDAILLEVRSGKQYPARTRWRPDSSVRSMAPRTKRRA